jgi:NTE family protein
MRVCVALVGSAAAAPCYAVAFSGGGDKGAFEAGVIQGLVNRLPASERQWDIMTGISAGSILASAGALFDKGDEVAMAQYMIDAVTNFTQDSVFKQWLPFGVLTGLDKSGVVNTEPLYNTLEGVLSSRPLGNRNFTIGATRDSTGTLERFSESDVVNASQWAAHIRASSAMPGLFDSVNIDGAVYSDGGCVMGVDIFAAVTRCQAAGALDTEITVDVISTGGEKAVKAWTAGDDNSFDLLVRGLDLQRYNQQMSDIYDACMAYPNINWRYYIEPTVRLPSNGKSFNKTQMTEMVQIGLTEAAAASSNSACGMAEAHRHSHGGPTLV